MQVNADSIIGREGFRNKKILQKADAGRAASLCGV